MSLTARSPFRARGPFRLRGPWRLVAGQPWGAGGAESFFDGGKTFDLRKMTLAALLSAGLSNAQATTNPPGTVVGPSGVVQYGAHNLARQSTDFSQAVWQVFGTASKGGTTASGTSVSFGGSASAQFYQNYAWVLGAQFVVVRFRVFAASPTTVRVYYTAGSDVVSSDQVVGTTPTDVLFASPGAVSPAAFGLQNNSAGTTGTITVQACELIVLAVQGQIPAAAYVPTTTAAVYAPRLTCDRVATSNVLPWSGNLSNAAWTKRGTATAVDVTLSNGVAASRITVGTANTNDCYFITNVVAGASQRTEIGLWLSPVTTSGTLVVQSPFGAANGQWSIDLSKVIGVQWVTRGHPAVAIANEFVASGGGTTGVLFYCTAGCTVDVAPAQNVGALPPPAYLRTFATAPLYSAGTPTAQNLVASQDLTNSTYWDGSSVVTPSALGAVGPGGAQAYRLTKSDAVGFRAIRTTTASALGSMATGTTYTLYLAIRGGTFTSADVDVLATTWLGSRVDVVSGSGSVSASGPARVTGLDANWTVLRIRGSLGVGTPQVYIYPGTNATGGAGNYVDVSTIMVHEGTADLAYTATNGTPVSVYPQRAMKREPQRTNSIRNSTMQGASAGVAPTDWNAATNGNGLTATIVGTGTALGQTYVDIRYSGTTSSTAKGQIIMQSPSAAYAPASNGQAWTLSSYVAVVGGSLANCSVELGMDEMSAVPAVLASGYQSITPTVLLMPFAFTRTNGNASTASVRSHININPTGAGVAIDITLRILMPQLEQGGTASTFIPTTSAAVTRSADLFRPGNLVTDGPMTVLVQARADKVVSGSPQALVGRTGAGRALYISDTGLLASNDGTNTASSGITPADGVSFRVAASWGGSTLAISANGAAAVSGAFDGTMGSGSITGFGDDGAGGNQASCDFEVINIIAQQATAAQLAALTAGTLQ